MSSLLVLVLRVSKKVSLPELNLLSELRCLEHQILDDMSGYLLDWAVMDTLNMKSQRIISMMLENLFQKTG